MNAAVIYPFDRFRLSQTLRLLKMDKQQGEFGLVTILYMKLVI